MCVCPSITGVAAVLAASLVLFGCGNEMPPPSLSFQNLAGQNPISTHSLPFEVKSVEGDSTTVGLSLKGVTLGWKNCCSGNTKKSDAFWKWSYWPDSIIVSAAIDIIKRKPLEF